MYSIHIIICNVIHIIYSIHNVLNTYIYVKIICVNTHVNTHRDTERVGGCDKANVIEY